MRKRKSARLQDEGEASCSRCSSDEDEAPWDEGWHDPPRKNQASRHGRSRRTSLSPKLQGQFDNALEAAVTILQKAPELNMVAGTFTEQLYKAGPAFRRIVNECGGMAKFCNSTCGTLRFVRGEVAGRDEIQLGKDPRSSWKESEQQIRGGGGKGSAQGQKSLSRELQAQVRKVLERAVRLFLKNCNIVEAGIFTDRLYKAGPDFRSIINECGGIEKFCNATQGTLRFVRGETSGQAEIHLAHGDLGKSVTGQGWERNGGGSGWQGRGNRGQKIDARHSRYDEEASHQERKNYSPNDYPDETGFENSTSANAKVAIYQRPQAYVDYLRTHSKPGARFSERFAGIVKCGTKDFGFIINHTCKAAFGKDVFVQERKLTEAHAKNGSRVTFLLQLDDEMRPQASHICIYTDNEDDDKDEAKWNEDDDGDEASWDVDEDPWNEDEEHAWAHKNKTLGTSVPSCSYNKRLQVQCPSVQLAEKLRRIEALKARLEKVEGKEKAKSKDQGPEQQDHESLRMLEEGDAKGSADEDESSQRKAKPALLRAKARAKDTALTKKARIERWSDESDGESRWTAKDMVSQSSTVCMEQESKGNQAQCEEEEEEAQWDASPNVEYPRPASEDNSCQAAPQIVKQRWTDFFSFGQAASQISKRMWTAKDCQEEAPESPTKKARIGPCDDECNWTENDAPSSPTSVITKRDVDDCAATCELSACTPPRTQPVSEDASLARFSPTKESELISIAAQQPTPAESNVEHPPKVAGPASACDGWMRMESRRAPGVYYYYNAQTGEKQAEPPDHWQNTRSATDSTKDFNALSDVKNTSVAITKSAEQESVLERLKTAKEMLDGGLITQEDYEKLKVSLLEKMAQ
eukprot:gnl/MRDRNA2_/MRDRNA2_117616_c0_seq1.p1 gnl/MRDRNA2_/MRDRNA2_117616_c0~~gnl/MRDRNA2_/MRDRNA2_117616_c0_seq1.p1  ORF type:complete len:863 (+),score=197.30 gnl/MRDRNA2_/MRDRNA2_117616_c0_seq1:98-2686(+)